MTRELLSSESRDNRNLCGVVYSFQSDNSIYGAWIGPVLAPVIINYQAQVIAKRGGVVCIAIRAEWDALTQDITP